MPYTMHAIIKSVDAEVRGPIIIDTNRGRFQTRRGITSLARHQLLQAACGFEKSGALCELRYNPQSRANHTVLSITEVSG